MNESDEKLAHLIKLKFGTAPQSPTDAELYDIKQDIQALVDRGITPSYENFRSIVSKYCPYTGQYLYKGLDNSDLTTLLLLATGKK